MMRRTLRPSLVVWVMTCRNGVRRGRLYLKNNRLRRGQIHVVCPPEIRNAAPGRAGRRSKASTPRGLPSPTVATAHDVFG
jgi:hypothetical protein